MKDRVSIYSRMLDVAMKDVDRAFWTSYLDDILTFSGQPLTYVKKNMQHALTSNNLKSSGTEKKFFLVSLFLILIISN